MRARTPLTPRQDRGMALISVLWIVALLALITAAVLTQMRLHVTDLRAEIDSARLRWLADGAVQRGLLDLLAGPDGGTIPRDGTAVIFQQADMTVTLRITDETGKLDLNTAPKPLLAGLVNGLGLEDASGRPVDADALADAVIDWRDRNTVAELLGAERATYETLGLPQLPRDGPFPTVLELGNVRAVTPALYAALAPYVTTASRARAVNPATAPRAVLMALPGAAPAQVDALLAARAAGARRPRLARADLWLTDRTGPGFLIEATVALPSGARYRTRLLVWIEGYGVDVPMPYVLERRPGVWLSPDADQ